MVTIKILEQDTINKIAAGEIIERPASIVKELLENSADSGADRIEVDFDGGGKSYIRVKDNGSGIPAEELPLALEPHATSKINSIDDLNFVKTFGFRGEALASMAAVSELTILSSPKDEKGKSAGASVHSSGGKIAEVKPAAPIGGTEVIIKNLFFNVPARYKFLKSEAAETTALKKTFKSFALSNPSIALTLKQNHQVIEHWPAQDFFKRSLGILKLAETDAIYFNHSEGALKLEAVLGLPERSLATQQSLYVFVQGRHVSDKTIQHAVFEGYRNLIMQNQYPQAVISLWVDPQNVDVNIHPTKAQVKFTDSSTIFRFISSTIRQGLEEKYSSSKHDGEASPQLFGAKVLPGQNLEMSGQEMSMFEFSNLEGVKNSDYRNKMKLSEQASLVQDAVTQYNKRYLAFNQGNEEIRTYSNGPLSTSPNESQGKSSSRWSALQLIGQFANTYLVTQSHETLVMVDQHAAHERVLFEKFKLNHEGRKAEKQIQLIEELIELSPETVEALVKAEMLRILDDVGFEISQRGLSTIGIATRPVLLLDVSLKPLFERLGEQVQEMGSKSVLSDLVGDIIASMACHGAIRAGRVLTLDEMQALLNQMDEFSFSSFCPHGRPVSVKFSLYEIEKLFKRIV